MQWLVHGTAGFDASLLGSTTHEAGKHMQWCKCKQQNLFARLITPHSGFAALQKVYKDMAAPGQRMAQPHSLC